MPAPIDPRDAGFDPDRLERLAAAIEQDVAAELYDGCEVVIARGGLVAFHRQFGFADRASGRKVVPAQPFVTMSIGKQLTVAAVFQRIVTEWHGRIAQAILRNWEIAEEVVVAVVACENHDREHEGATDLTDVLAVGSAMAPLGPSPVAEQMLFLGMPAARRMKLDAERCIAALRESHEEIQSLRQALGS